MIKHGSGCQVVIGQRSGRVSRSVSRRRQTLTLHHLLANTANLLLLRLTQQWPPQHPPTSPWIPRGSLKLVKLRALSIGKPLRRECEARQIVNSSTFQARTWGWMGSRGSTRCTLLGTECEVRTFLLHGVASHCLCLCVHMLTCILAPIHFHF